MFSPILKEIKKQTNELLDVYIESFESCIVPNFTTPGI